ncbi:hypothetical protein WYH_01432 [Croceibacterium atlanticum]|uniref:ABC-type transport auxiliary lipoprotein component domain-containing protein n=2 Tax=Croceibacterium atlanticum TaxID=1267766 RepID=A0A0F7KPM8_9SPHN|nr:hypothetical protein WYH_01432 [Croceibacterium atlanticum]
MLAAAISLSGCISLGNEPPERLFTLTPEKVTAVGNAAQGELGNAISVIEPDAPQRLSVTRVPVQIDPSSVAYLKDAVWVDKPAKLFQRLLSETIRAGGERLVVDGGDLQYAAATQLSGQIVDLGYDAQSGSAIVRFDAVLKQPDGQLRTRRFESVVSGIPAKADAVGPALNEAANDVAAQIAEWVG